MNANEKTLEELRKRIKGEAPNPMGLATIKARIVTVTKAELLEAVKANPKHPAADVYAKAVADLGPSDEIHVESVDLEALMANKSVATVRTTGEDGPVVEKVLGDSLEAPRPLFDKKPKPEDVKT